MVNVASYVGLGALIALHLFPLIAECKSPNIVFILTDDEDQLLSGSRIVEHNIMPNRQRIFVENGISFNYAFASTPTCCVSRSSILTGKFVQNHQVTNNSVAGNCWSSRFRATQEPYSYAAYLHEYGEYNTFYAGKYLNEYGEADTIGDSAFDIPFGYDHWYALAGDIRFYNYCQSNMGEQQCYGFDPQDYHTTVIRNHAMDFLQSRKTQDDGRPFLLVFSTIGCHSPFTVEDKYQGLDFGQKSPRTPNWNMVVGADGDHHSLLKQQSKMDEVIIAESDQIYAMRLGTLRSVDDAIGDIYNYIDEQLDEKDNTYFIYASDHGFHNGQWAMAFSKMLLYETDVRIPFYMHGPDLKRGAESNVFATTVDIAPTILDIAGIDLQQIDDGNQMDGKSLLPYSVMDGEDEAEVEEEEMEEQVFLIEYHGQGFDADSYLPILSNIPGFHQVVSDAWNNTYACLRWMNEKSGADFKYCKFKCFASGMVEADCDRSTTEARGEFYDLAADPWEMNNIYNELSDAQHEALTTRLKNFKSCVGDKCRELYTTPISTELEKVKSQKKRSKFKFDSLLVHSLL